MGKILGAIVAAGFLTTLFVIFMDIIIVQFNESKLDQIDMLIAKKVSVYNGFTPEVEQEAKDVIDSIPGLDFKNFDFSGTTIEPVEWGETVTVQYQVEQSIIQKGMEFLKLPSIEFRPRDFQVVAMGRPL